MSTKYITPPDPNSNTNIAKMHLMCIETFLLDIKSINTSNQTAKLELLVAISSIETFLNKAKDLIN